MATINYNIDSGTAPFTASINPAVASDNIHTSTGSFYFTNIPDGEYSITIVDSVGCQAIFDASVYCSTTTTTTGIPTTTTTTLPPTTTTTTLLPTTTTTTIEQCCPYVSNFSTGGFQMAHALINDGTYLYAGERINNTTPSSVARIIKYNTNLTEVGSYEVGANKDVESMCYDSVNNRIYASQIYDDGIATRVSILVINPSTMLPVSQTNYTTLITGKSFPIVTDGTYIYGATFNAPPVIFKIRISDMALVSTVTWTGRERAHAARIDTRYGYMYLTDIPYSAGTNPYFAKVRLSTLAYTEVNIGDYVRKATDDFAMIDTGSNIYCYIGGEYVYTSGGNAGYGGVQVRVSDLSLTGIAMKPSYAVCEYGDEIYSATIDGNMQIFSRTDLNNVLTCNLSGFYPNELNVLGNRLFGANFNGYNETEGKMLEFNLCYYFPTTTTTSTTLVPPTTTTTTTLPPTTTTTTTLCNVAKYSPNNRDTWCGWDSFHNGGCVSISDKQLNPLYLDNVESAITEYCKNEKSNNQTASGRQPFYLTEGKTIEVGDPVYKFNLINNCELNEETFTTLLTTGISPCKYRNVVAIRVAGGYIIEKRTLFVK